MFSRIKHQMALHGLDGNSNQNVDQLVSRQIFMEELIRNLFSILQMIQKVILEALNSLRSLLMIIAGTEF